MTDIRESVAVTAVGMVSTPIAIRGPFNVTTRPAPAFVGAVTIERSYDGGGTYGPLAFRGGAALFLQERTSISFDEPAANALYRVRAAGYTSGTMLVVFSQ